LGASKKEVQLYYFKKPSAQIPKLDKGDKSNLKNSCQSASAGV